jgi:hypothetical protein
MYSIYSVSARSLIWARTDSTINSLFSASSIYINNIRTYFDPSEGINKAINNANVKQIVYK